MLSKEEVLKQSEGAFAHWGDVWKENARRNGEKYKTDGRTQKDLLFRGKGRVLVCVGMGPSLEMQIDKLKNVGTGVDIACVDKAFFYLMEHGIKPQYVVTADSGISFDKYCKKYLDQTDDIILIANVVCNLEWSLNWKGPVYYHVNKDNIETEKIYAEESGCREIIPASSNVGNTVVVFATQLFDYDKYCLIGYDFCWRYDSNYYAFEDSDKRYWMNHHMILDKNGELAKTSQNLLFSCKWLQDFYTAELKKRGVEIFDCSRTGICSIPSSRLEKHIHAEPRKISSEEKKHIVNLTREKFVINATDGNEKLNKALKELLVTDIIINHIPHNVAQFLEAR